MTTTIQIRVDAKTKKQAQTIFEKMGLDLSSGVKLYLAQVIREQGIPFTPRTVNGFTPAQEAKLLAESAWTLKHGKRYKNVDELMDNLLT